MYKQIIFIIVLVLTLGVFYYTVNRLYAYLRLTKPVQFRDFGKRFVIMMKVAIAQTKIFRMPAIGFVHAMVFWGFIVITIGSLEMVVDGVAGLDKSFAFMGFLYDFIIGAGDFFAYFIGIAILLFLFRRLFMHINRFYGEEMKKISKVDANVALTIILLLMVSLTGMNVFYLALHSENYSGYFPVSSLFIDALTGLDHDAVFVWHEFFWWTHIVLIFIFANILPYSKHFHVFMSVPNVFLSRLEPLGKMVTMDDITREVKLMLDPSTAYATPAEKEVAPARFGVKDVEDITMKNYLDALSCTECGRCTSVCPAHITGKRLSPRKIMIDVRARMKEKGPGLISQGISFSDGKSLLHQYISTEEIWACTTCNACVAECPININQPELILDLRRYLVLEESAAPSGLNAMFTNIENNGAPWKYSPADRMNWADELYRAN